MSEIRTSEDSWDGLFSNYLKAEHLKEESEDFVCIGVEIDGKEMEIEVQRNEETPFTFSLNITNKLFLKEHGISTPKGVIGKVLTIKKVMARNPTLNKEVESLRIAGIR